MGYIDTSSPNDLKKISVQQGILWNITHFLSQPSGPSLLGISLALRGHKGLAS